jgi:hypothetical protein
MTSYIRTRIPLSLMELFQNIKRVLEALPDLDLGTRSGGEQIVLDCHMVARAIGRTFGLNVVDGRYAGTSHSWIELFTPDPPTAWVIDTYPILTFPGPLLLMAESPIMPGRKLYRRTRNFGRQLPFSSPEFRRSVNLIAKEIRRIIQS